ncbi:hypothetical protein [Hydrogenivirga sp. 128-5-R1-1]|uniref:hypothetical protein n=1 Tax=Hydrogenivirga sp. 128-5-R1-1 TaxID=392423 RepID=UPI00015F1790|nr:hypothetical protein [Hydrogenivirga sp. 128-5-R1-1]EDP76096.1 hypothetical protein HG1285_18039 [Hydrogenivirga sp. 128-5-R1-1]
MKFEEFKKELENLREFAEGWRGKIYRGEWKGVPVSLKVAKNEHVIRAIRKEADILERLKGMEEFPQLILKGEDFFMYRFIEGTPLGKLNLSPEEEKGVLRKLLEIAYRLDRLGIAKEEFAHIYKNVLMDKRGRLYVLDFERGKFTKRPTNVTQFLQLLTRRGYISRDEAIELGRRHLKNGEEVFETLKAKLE